jgi:hypothetical protein
MREHAVSETKANHSGIRWKRVIATAFVSEFVVIAVIAIFIGVNLLLMRGQVVDTGAVAERVGYYAAVPAAAVATFLCSVIALRNVRGACVANGVLIGLVETLLTLGFFFSAKPEDRMMYLASFGARIMAGYLGGVVADKRKGDPAHDFAREVR